MPALSLTAVSFGYSSHHDVIRDVDLDLGPQWYGMVGPNGSGKTTLLRLMAGELQPSSGSIHTSGVLVRCHQSVQVPGAEVLALAEDHSAAAYATRGRWELDPSQTASWAELSPGERRRWQVAAALQTQPDILLLDEPTNHLDASAVSLLTSMLRSHRGVGVVVSHDRTLLDGLTDATIRVHSGAVDSWSTHYSVAREEWRRSEAQLVAEADRRTGELRRVEQRLAAEQRTAAEKTAAWTRSQRYARPGDHDATSTSRTQRFREGQAAGAARLSRTRAKAERAADHRASLVVAKDHRDSIEFDSEPARRQVLVSRSGPLVAGHRVLADDVEMVVERTSTIRITGPNGAGKTTLAEDLVARWDLPTERLFHLAQELSDDEMERLISDLTSLDRSQLGRIMQLFARLGGEPATVLASDRPSPGEARKLLIASALVRGVWCLILDEPTNHLDLDTVETLEAALAAHAGALVVISHDERFATAVTTSEVRL